MVVELLNAVYVLFQIVEHHGEHTSTFTLGVAHEFLKVEIVEIRIMLLLNKLVFRSLPNNL